MSAEPALGLRERKKIKTRATIREHALRLFLEQGYGETSIEQIADAAEVSPSTFFRYFPTKEDVVLADDLDPILLRALADQPVDSPPLKALRDAMAATFNALTPEDIQQELERQQLLSSVPELRPAIMVQLYRSIDLIATATAQRLGRSADDFEVRVFAGAVTGAVMGGTLLGATATRDTATGDTASPNGGIDQAIRAVQFLEAGLPLSPVNSPPQ